MKRDDKEKIHSDIYHAGYYEGQERRLRIAHAPEYGSLKVIEKDHGKTCDIDTEIKNSHIDGFF